MSSDKPSLLEKLPSNFITLFPYPCWHPVIDSMWCMDARCWRWFVWRAILLLQEMLLYLETSICYRYLSFLVGFYTPLCLLKLCFIPYDCFSFYSCNLSACLLVSLERIPKLLRHNSASNLEDFKLLYPWLPKSLF